MSGTINTRIKSKKDTTANWNAARGFIPLSGEIIIYSDYKSVTKEIDGIEKIILVPGFKVGDGRTYVQDLPFSDEELRKAIVDHINNSDVHVTLADRIRWNEKLNVNDNAEVVDGALIFNRD